MGVMKGGAAAKEAAANAVIMWLGAATTAALERDAGREKRDRSSCRLTRQVAASYRNLIVIVIVSRW